VNDGQSSPIDYQEWRRSAWQLWKAWLALIVLSAANFFLAYLPLGAGNLALSLAIAALMIAVLSTFLMGLRNSRALIRIVAGAGLFWTSLMFVLTFCDFLSRHY
jgi:cytochrome c oxidase subunit 4